MSHILFSTLHVTKNRIYHLIINNSCPRVVRYPKMHVSMIIEEHEESEVGLSSSDGGYLLCRVIFASAAQVLDKRRLQYILAI
jgi:hypothetical protein